MATKDIEKKLKVLQDEIERLKDIEEIKKLQRIYGYYLEHWECDNMVDLFSDSPDTTAEVSDNGLCVGKEEIRKFFSALKDPPPEFLHIMMIVSGVVDLDEDGKTAKGRWYAFGCLALPMQKGETRPFFAHGVYENEYVKEHGKWKIKKLHFNRTFLSPYEDGWVKTPVVSDNYAHKGKGISFKPPTSYKPYPSGYIVPYHYKNPASGR